MLFNKIGIRFIDIDYAVQFFITILGFRQHSLLLTQNKKRIICIEKNNIVLELFETTEPFEKRGFLKLLSFEVDDIKKTINELRKKDVKIVEDITKSSDKNANKFLFAYFEGPESIKLGLFQKL